MTIVKYKLVASASRPFNPLGNNGVTETRKEILSAYAASVRERLGMSLAEVASEDHVIPGTISDVLVCLKKPESVHAVVLGITNLAKGEYRTQLANNPQVTAFLARALRSKSSVTAKHARSAIRTLMSPNFNGIQLKNNPDMIRELSTSLGQAEDDSVTTVVSAIETLAMSDANSRELAKQSELVAYLCDAMEDEAPCNAQSAAWLLAQLTKLEANRDVLARHKEVIPGLVKALGSGTTIWPAALALDHLNQLGVLKDKPAVVLYLLSNEWELNQELTAHMHRFISSDFSDNLANHVTTRRPQLRKSLLSTTRGPIYTKAFKTAMETYLRSLTVSEVRVFNARAAEIMDFAEAVIPKSTQFRPARGVYFLRSIRGLHMMLSDVPESERKTTLMTRLGWDTIPDLLSPAHEKEVPIQCLNPMDYELETRSLSEPALGTIYNDRQYLNQTIPIVTLQDKEVETRSLSEPALGEVYDDRGTSSAFL